MISYLIIFLIALHSKKIATVITLTIIVQILVSVMAGMSALHVDNSLAVGLLISFIAKLALGVCVFYIYQRMTRRVTPKEYRKHKIVTSTCVTAVIILMTAFPVYLAIQDGQQYKQSTEVSAELVSDTKAPRETTKAKQEKVNESVLSGVVADIVARNQSDVEQNLQNNPLGIANTDAVQQGQWLGTASSLIDIELVGYAIAGALLCMGLLILLVALIEAIFSRVEALLDSIRIPISDQNESKPALVYGLAEAIKGFTNNLSSQFKWFLIIATSTLIILALTGWIGFWIVVAGGAFFWYRTVSVGRETTRSFLFLLALEQGKNIVEANTFAYASPTDSSDIANAAQQYAALHFGGSYFVMCNAAKGSGFYH